MPDTKYVTCPSCDREFIVGDEFYRLPEAYCCCPFCHTEFRVGVAANQEQQSSLRVNAKPDRSASS